MRIVAFCFVHLQIEFLFECHFNWNVSFSKVWFEGLFESRGREVIDLFESLGRNKLERQKRSGFLKRFLLYENGRDGRVCFTFSIFLEARRQFFGHSLAFLSGNFSQTSRSGRSVHLWESPESIWCNYPCKGWGIDRYNPDPYGIDPRMMRDAKCTEDVEITDLPPFPAEQKIPRLPVHPFPSASAVVLRVWRDPTEQRVWHGTTGPTSWE